MSKITFRHRAKDLKSQTKTPLKIRLVVGRNCSLEMKSGKFVSPIDWNKERGVPIDRKTKECTEFKNKINALRSYIETKLEASEKANEIINLEWLAKHVDIFNGKIPKEKEEALASNFLTDHIQKYIELAPTKKVRNKSSLGLAPNTIIKYKSFLNMIIRYEKVIKKRIVFKELDKRFYNNFINWLLVKEKYSLNYAGKQIDNLKTMCSDAIGYEIEVNNYYNKMQSFKEDDEDRYIVTFSFEEIEIIHNTVMPNESLENTRKWMILGFEIGQRGNDLMAIDKKNITSEDEDGNIYLEVYQQKTKKWVNVALINPNAINILQNNFPYPIAIQNLNENMKKVAEICGFSEQTAGKKFNAETGRKEFGVYPKHELTTSHTLRRSFSTNWHQLMETSIIMEITGHTKEEQFREYINVRVNKEEGARNFAEKARNALRQIKLQKLNKTA